jgi:hypothetical protein
LCRIAAALRPLQGFFIPVYHKAYWMGLKLNGTWPNFSWRDPYVARGYNQWSLVPPAPGTTTADVIAGYAPGHGTPIAYGWVDEVANATKKVALCRTVSKCPGLALACGWQASCGPAVTSHALPPVACLSCHCSWCCAAGLMLAATMLRPVA